MPAPIRSDTPSDGDTYSLMSQATTTMTIGDSLPAQLVRKSARRGFTFNIMSVGQPNLGQATLLSALFGKKLDISAKERSTDKESVGKEQSNPSISVEAKTFEIDEKKVRLRLTVVDCKNYAQAQKKKNSYKPLVDYIDEQFAHYYKQESSYDRRQMQDKRIHCLFFFIYSAGHGLSELDLDFLKAVHEKVHIIPIIARSEVFTEEERALFKRRVKEDLEKNNIDVYQMPDPDPEDTDDIKRSIREIRSAMPFAVTSMKLMPDCTPTFYGLNYGKIDPFNRDHSDFLLLKTMLHMQMPDLCDSTHEKLYEEYRQKLNGRKPKLTAP